MPYCELLRDAGYDTSSSKWRPGDQPAQTGYEPLQWLRLEVIDSAAVAYLKTRPDWTHAARPLASAAAVRFTIAAQDDFIRCFVVDGVFA